VHSNIIIEGVKYRYFAQSTIFFLILFLALTVLYKQNYTEYQAIYKDDQQTVTAHNRKFIIKQHLKQIRHLSWLSQLSEDVI